MKLLPFAIGATCLLLAGCGSNGPQAANTLLQIQHDQELADTLANLIIADDPIIKEPGMREFIEQQITKAKRSLAAAQSEQNERMTGAFAGEKQTVQGWITHDGNSAHTSSDFYSQPGVDLHMYLTTVVDPRDVTFPDVTAVDLGAVSHPYGPLSFDVPKAIDLDTYRTAALWDVKLKRLYGFAQLSKRH